MLKRLCPIASCPIFSIRRVYIQNRLKFQSRRIPNTTFRLNAKLHVCVCVRVYIQGRENNLTKNWFTILAYPGYDSIPSSDHGVYLKRHRSMYVHIIKDGLMKRNKKRNGPGLFLLLLINKCIRVSRTFCFSLTK